MRPDFLLTNMALPMVELFSQSRFWSMYKEMDAFQNLENANQLDLQKNKLAKLLRYAGENTEFWNKRLSDSGFDAKHVTSNTVLKILKSLPTTTKSDYRGGFPDKVTAQEHRANWQYLSSAGTNDRMTIITDFKKRDYLRASEHLGLKLVFGHPLGKPTLDIPPNACNVVCGLMDEGPEPLNEYLFWALKEGLLSNKVSLADIRGRVERQILLKRKTLLPIDPGPWDVMRQQLDAYLTIIVKEKIEVLRGLPQFLYWLAKRVKEKRLSLPHIRAVLPYGGLASEAIVDEITSAFEAPFINLYGSGEVGAIGHSSSEPELINVYQNLIFLEILDENNYPVEPNNPGKIVVTDLTNFAMPIIRYEIGDIGVPIDTHGDQPPSKLKLLGRTQECLITRNNRLVTTRDLQNTFLGRDQIINFKLEVLSNDLYRASVVCTDTFDDKTLAEDLAELLEVSKPPAIKKISFITPESSGKYVSIKTMHNVSSYARRTV